MKLPQAFSLLRLIRRVKTLNPQAKRVVVLSGVVITCFLLVLPLLKYASPQVNTGTVASAGSVTSQVAVQPLEVAESVDKGKQGPKPAQPALSKKDFRLPVTGKELRGTGKELSWWEVLGDYRLHPGADIQAPEGTKVVAAASGRVVELGTDPVYGKVLVLDHGSGWVSVYGQLENIKVQLNAKVSQGQLLAQVGKPAGGEADMEAHLHYELRHDEKILNGGNIAE